MSEKIEEPEELEGVDLDSIGNSSELEPLIGDINARIESLAILVKKTRSPSIKSRHEGLLQRYMKLKFDAVARKATLDVGKRVQREVEEAVEKVLLISAKVLASAVPNEVRAERVEQFKKQVEKVMEEYSG